MTLFSEFNSALDKIQQKINKEIGFKTTNNLFTEIFEDETRISTFINSLSNNSIIEDLKKTYSFLRTR